MQAAHGIATGARRGAWLLFVLLAGLGAAWSDASAVLVTVPRDGPASGPPPDVHVAGAIGYCRAQRWPVLQDGFIASLRLSIDPSPWWSPFLEVQSTGLTGTVTYRTFTQTLYTSREDRRLNAVAIGTRVHLVRRRLIRPFLEGGIAARFAGDQDRVYANDASSVTRVGPLVDEEGLAGFGRAGLSTAQWNGAGVFVDAGYEFLFKNPDQRGVTPVRFGILFP